MFLRKIFDPYKTIKHVSYREMRARYKREQAWADKFMKFIVVTVSIAIVILLAAENLVRLAP
jgi:hypothetical protein